MTRVPPRLNRKLILEEVSRVPDGSGGYVETWVELGRLWASVAAQSGRAAGEEEAELATVGYRITVRAAPPGSPSRPVPGQVLREGPRRFRIEAVRDQDPDARYLVCIAREEEVAQ